jgi:predicted TPR repeat methyltransferase
VTAPTLEEALAHHRAGRLQEAEAIYRARLEADPADADALHWLGVLASQCGQQDLALELIERALARRRGDPEILNNRGNVLNALGRHADAEGAFRRALTMAPSFTEAHYNLGHALKAQAKHEAAVEAYDRALQLNPDFVAAHYNRGLAQRALGRNEDAARSFRRCLELDPADGSGARLALAALGEAAAPDRADPAFVRGLYDHYAGNFDAHLVERLAYRAPEIIAEALMPHWPALPEKPSALDLGCGTGLAGVPLKPHLGQLSGVDVSPAMIARAAERGIYDALDIADLTAFLERPGPAFDLVIAADVLIYFGDLAPVMCGVARRLARPGRFVFTTEDAGPERIKLHQGLRYAHSAEYLREVLSTAGLGSLSMQPTATRREDDRPVAGWIVVAGQEK